MLSCFTEEMAQSHRLSAGALQRCRETYGTEFVAVAKNHTRSVGMLNQPKNAAAAP
jgi:hypothetical protein